MQEENKRENMPEELLSEIKNNIVSQGVNVEVLDILPSTEVDTLIPSTEVEE